MQRIFILKLSTNKISISINCKECNEPVIIKNDLAAALAHKHGIICDTCRRHPFGTRQYKDYDDYLKSEHWRSFRKRVFEHYGRKCYLCGTTEGQIDIHHNTYERKGAELLSDVIPLCHTHHEMYEEWG